MRKTSELDLTTGNIFLKIPLYVVPLMMTTVFQLLYTTIDLWTVSTFGGGSLSMSAIGSNSALINLIITVLVSLATGANVCISVAKGSLDKDRAEKILYTAFTVAIIGGIIFAIFGYFASPVLLVWMDTIPSIIDNATTYLKIYFLGVPLLMIYNYGSQMLRALGDSRRPLYVLIASGIVNIAFDLVFVIVLKMDVAGVAWATVISEGVSAILIILCFYFNDKGFIKLDFKKIKITMREFLDIIKIGLPAGLQGLAFSIPNVLIQSSLYSITNYSIGGIPISQEEIVSGASASAQIEGYIFAVIDSFSVGLISFIGQNLGAKNKVNIRKSYFYSVTWMLLFWGVCLLISYFYPNELLSIFVKDSEGINVENAFMAGKERLYIMAFTYFLDGWMDINSSYLRGMKWSTPPAIITLIGCTGTRILFLMTLFKTAYFHTIFWLYAAFPISWILVNAVYIPTILILERKTFRTMQLS